MPPASRCLPPVTGVRCHVFGMTVVMFVRRLREHGWSDEQIVETIAQVALNLFTNYINNVLDVDVDFTEVPFQS